MKKLLLALAMVAAMTLALATASTALAEHPGPPANVQVSVCQGPAGSHAPFCHAPP